MFSITRHARDVQLNSFLALCIGENLQNDSKCEKGGTINGDHPCLSSGGGNKTFLGPECLLVVQLMHDMHKLHFQVVSALVVTAKC